MKFEMLVIGPNYDMGHIDNLQMVTHVLSFNYTHLQMKCMVIIPELSDWSVGR